MTTHKPVSSPDFNLLPDNYSPSEWRNRLGRSNAELQTHNRFSDDAETALRYLQGVANLSIAQAHFKSLPFWIKSLAVQLKESPDPFQKPDFWKNWLRVKIGWLEAARENPFNDLNRGNGSRLLTAWYLIIPAETPPLPRLIL
jgi:hypothetical protein